MTRHVLKLDKDNYTYPKISQAIVNIFTLYQWPLYTVLNISIEIGVGW